MSSTRNIRHSLDFNDPRRKRASGLSLETHVIQNYLEFAQGMKNIPSDFPPNETLHENIRNHSGENSNASDSTVVSLSSTEEFAPLHSLSRSYPYKESTVNAGLVEDAVPLIELISRSYTNDMNKLTPKQNNKGDYPSIHRSPGFAIARMKERHRQDYRRSLQWTPGNDEKPPIIPVRRASSLTSNANYQKSIFNANQQHQQQQQFLKQQMHVDSLIQIPHQQPQHGIPSHTALSKTHHNNRPTGSLMNNAGNFRYKVQAPLLTITDSRIRSQAPNIMTPIQEDLPPHPELTTDSNCSSLPKKMDCVSKQACHSPHCCKKIPTSYHCHVSYRTATPASIISAQVQKPNHTVKQTVEKVVDPKQRVNSQQTKIFPKKRSSSVPDLSSLHKEEEDVFDEMSSEKKVEKPMIKTAAIISSTQLHRCCSRTKSIVRDSNPRKCRTFGCCNLQRPCEIVCCSGSYRQAQCQQQKKCTAYFEEAASHSHITRLAPQQQPFCRSCHH